MNRLFSYMNFQQMVTIPLVVAAMIAGLAASALAQAQQTHTVRQGDTLFSIAQSYDITVEQLRDWNDLSGNDLTVGQQLLVSSEASSDNPGAIYHTVEAQETLFSISKQYSVSIPEIKRWNELSSNNLDLGQRLVIYPPEEGSEAVQQSQSTLIVNTPTDSNTYYTVKSGDTLYDIAREHNMSLQQLKSLNDLSSNTIRIGQRLTVHKQEQTAPSVSENLSDSTPQGAFVVHKVGSGESLRDLLNSYNMSEEEFRALNPDINDEVRSGQQVTVLLPPSRSYTNPYTIQANLRDLGQTSISVYDSSMAGSTTTSGELYNPGQLTAAHSNIALGNVIYIENPQTQKGVFVRINDRFSGQGLKLSQEAARVLGVRNPAEATITMYQDQ